MQVAGVIFTGDRCHGVEASVASQRERLDGGLVARGVLLQSQTTVPLPGLSGGGVSEVQAREIEGCRCGKKEYWHWCSVRCSVHAPEQLEYVGGRGVGFSCDLT